MRKLTALTAMAERTVLRARRGGAAVLSFALVGLALKIRQISARERSDAL